MEDGKEFFSTAEGKSFLKTITIYILSVTDIDDKILVNNLEKISEEGGQIAMTTAVRLRQEGRQEGIEKKAMGVAKKMLVKGYPISDIAEITGLSEKQIRELK